MLTFQINIDTIQYRQKHLFYMKLLSIRRKTETENRYSKKMGRLETRVIYIQKYLLGLPIKTIHKYRETYYGEVKDCENCNLFI